MASLKIELKGEGPIDNASIYLEDPAESIEIKLNPSSDTKWGTTLNLPVQNELDYSLYVVAFSGTRFECVITNLDTNKSIKFDGKTGYPIKNRAHVSGAQNF
jgi:hypothetical protein